MSYVNGIETLEYPFTLAGNYPVTKSIKIVEGSKIEWNELKKVAEHDERIHMQRMN
jgi:hypothetical protein